MSHENRTVIFMNKRTSMFLLINFGKYISNCYWVSKMIHVCFSWYQMIYPVWTRRGLTPALLTVRVDLWVTEEHTFLRSLPSAVKMAVPGHRKSRSTEKYYLYYPVCQGSLHKWKMWYFWWMGNSNFPKSEKVVRNCSQRNVFMNFELFQSVM